MNNQVIYSNERPDILIKLENRFGVDWNDDLIIAWNGKIHSKNAPSAEKIVHEMVHLEEQSAMGNDAWWECYLNSPEFRLEQEIKAYKAEADFVKKYIKNREHRYKMIHEMAKNLSSSIYGGIIGMQEALRLLR